MSLHDHDSHDHAGGPPRAMSARRDLLGLAALLGPDSGLVPISDLDAGAEWPGGCGMHGGVTPHEHAAPGSAPKALPTLCGSCTTRCATVDLGFGRNQSTERTS
jgi:hypothetical protein